MEPLVVYLNFRVFSYQNEEPREDEDQHIDKEYIKNIEEMVPAVGESITIANFGGDGELDVELEQDVVVTTNAVIVDLRKMWIIWNISYDPADFSNYNEDEIEQVIIDYYTDTVEEITASIIPYEKWVRFAD